MAEQLRKMIERAVKDGKSVRAVAIEAGVPQPVLHRFMAEERDLTLTTVQKLADYFGLELRQR
jgi:hypothetical protein